MVLRANSYAEVVERKENSEQVAVDHLLQFLRMENRASLEKNLQVGKYFDKEAVLLFNKYHSPDPVKWMHLYMYMLLNPYQVFSDSSDEKETDSDSDKECKSLNNATQCIALWVG